MWFRHMQMEEMHLARWGERALSVHPLQALLLPWISTYSPESSWNPVLWRFYGGMIT